MTTTVEQSTSNIGHRTTVLASVRHSMFNVRCSMFVLGLWAAFIRAPVFRVKPQ
jgi:hypothetical protein